MPKLSKRGSPKRRLRLAASAARQSTDTSSDSDRSVSKSISSSSSNSGGTRFSESSSSESSSSSGGRRSSVSAAAVNGPVVFDRSLQPLPEAEVRSRALSPGRSREIMSLSRMSWSAARVKAFIHRTQHGRWSENTLPKARYLLERAYGQHRWNIERLRKNRFTARVLDEDAFETAAENDGELRDTDEAEEGEAEGDNDGDAVVADADDEMRIGEAVDGSSDDVLEDVLFVQARSRSPQRLGKDGKLDYINPSTWYEIVPKSRVQTVLKSVFHSAGGTLFTTASTLYKQLAETYIGISHHDVSRFLASAEAAVRSRSNIVADAIIAPSQPQRLGQRWATDLTFADGTLPFAPYAGFMTTVDALSRYVWTAPIEDKSASTIATILETLFETEGPPEVLQLDNSWENHSDTVRLICQRHSVKLRFTRPYKSQENGLVEVAHKTLKSLLRKAIIDTQAAGQGIDIGALLASVTRMYNASPHSVTGLPPFLVWRGRPPPKLAPAIVMRKSEEEDDDNAGAGAASPLGAASQKQKSAGPRSVATSISRTSKRELLDLLEFQQQQTAQQREIQRRKRLQPPPSQSSAGSGGRRPRLEARMSPIDATLQRLGISQGQGSLLSKRKSEIKASNSSSSSAAPAVSLNDNWKLGRVLGIVYDAVAKRLLYGIRWAPPYDDPSRDVWLPAAWIGNATDAQMSTWIKRKHPNDPPVVFSRPFTGPPSLDRQKAIPFDTVLHEVESDDGGDGQGSGEAFEGRDVNGQEIVETIDDKNGQNGDLGSVEDDDGEYAPGVSNSTSAAGNGITSIELLEAARRQLQRVAAAQQLESVATRMDRVRGQLAAVPSAAAGAGAAHGRPPFASSSSSSKGAAAGTSTGGARRW